MPAMLCSYKKRFKTSSASEPTRRTAHSAVPHLEAEEADGADDEVLAGGASGGQHDGQVADSQREEEQEAQKVAPDVDALVGEDKEAAGRHGGAERGSEVPTRPRGRPYLRRQRREGR